MVRQLKARRCEHLGEVRAGEEVVVTQRGRSIARLVPFPSADALPECMVEMERHGLARPGVRPVAHEFLGEPPRAGTSRRAVQALLSKRKRDCEVLGRFSRVASLSGGAP